MTQPLPFVSVIIPVHNAGRHLWEAIDSIEQQGHHPLEIIVVDDGSTDDTATIIAGFGNRVRALHQQNAGPAAARNAGLAVARGDVIAFCDADDRWPSGKLQLQLGRLADDPDLDIVLGRVQYVAEGGEPYPNIAFEDPDAKTMLHVHVGSGVYRRRVFERIGSFDESFQLSEDVDWFLRAREQGVEIRILRDVTLYYRLHGRNMTRGRTLHEFQFLPVLKKSLERRRAAGTEGTNLRLWRDLDEEWREGMDAPTPTVSVVMAVFDDTRYLEEAIDSALAQSHRPLEVIVIDDGSEEPVVLPKRYPREVVLVRAKHSGQAAARNLGITRAHGDVLAFLDADDVWLPEKLALQVALLTADERIDMVIGGYEEFVSPELTTVPGSPPPQVTERVAPLPSVVAVRTKAFRRVGAFREELFIGDFVDWYTRARELGLRDAAVDQVVTRRRIHDRNAGITLRDKRGQYARVLKERLDRKRAAP